MSGCDSEQWTHMLYSRRMNFAMLCEFLVTQKTDRTPSHIHDISDFSVLHTDSIQLKSIKNSFFQRRSEKLKF